MESRSTNKYRTWAKLIFNPGLEEAGKSTVKRVDGIRMFVFYGGDGTLDVRAAITSLSKSQTNEMRLATWLRFPRVYQLGVNLED